MLDRIRLSLRLFLPDRVRRREPVRLLRNRRQDLVDGAAAQAVPHVWQAIDACGVARSAFAYARGARRRYRAGRLFCNMLKADGAVGAELGLSRGGRGSAGSAR